MTVSPLSAVHFASHKPKQKLPQAALLSAALLASPMAVGQTVSTEGATSSPGKIVTLETPDGFYTPSQQTPPAQPNAYVYAPKPPEPYINGTKHPYDKAMQVISRKARETSDSFYALLMDTVLNNRPEMIRDAAQIKENLAKLQGYGLVMNVERKNWRATDKGAMSCDVNIQIPPVEMPLDSAHLVCDKDTLTVFKMPDGSEKAIGTGRFRQIHGIKDETEKETQALVFLDENGEPYSWYRASRPTVSNGEQLPLIEQLKLISSGYKCNNPSTTREKIVTLPPEVYTQPGRTYWNTTPGGWGSTVHERTVIQYVDRPIYIEKPGECEKPPTGSIPEPGSLALLGIGAVGLAASQRKKKKP